MRLFSMSALVLLIVSAAAANAAEPPKVAPQPAFVPIVLDKSATDELVRLVLDLPIRDQDTVNAILQLLRQKEAEAAKMVAEKKPK